MGGYGSGRKADKKTLTTEMLKLDIRFLHRRKLLRRGAFIAWAWQSKSGNEVSASIGIHIEHQYLLLKYYIKKSGNRWLPVSTKVFLDWTSCHYGGHRPWFRCPCCDSRVAILYAGKYYRCRICHNLAYPSENEGTVDRLFRQANKIRRRLNCEPGIQNRIIFAPKGMHYKTFTRLRFQVHWLEYKALRQIYDKFFPH